MALYDKAIRISDPFDTGQVRKVPVYGVTLHTTGSGLPSKALAAGQDPFQAGIDYYRKSMGPTYLIGWKPGQIAAIARDESVVTWHAGESDPTKWNALKSGAWRSMVSPATVQFFAKVWGDKNPLSTDGTTRFSVIPTAYANNSTIGVEIIPVTPGGSTLWERPMRPGLRFTQWQHDAARALAADLARRHNWPAGWQDTRIMGHEAMNPIDRHDAGGGWDPGWMRAAPYIDMNYIKGQTDLVALAVVGGLFGLAYLIKRYR